MTVLWRSLQYVPAHIRKYVESERILAADAVILDLQDSVPAAAKDDARGMAVEAAATLAPKGPDILVRINTGETGFRDLEAVVGPAVSAIVVPDVRSPADVRALARKLDQIEAEKVLTAGATQLLLLVESAAGLTRMAAVARASSRIAALNLGNEDLAHDLGVKPDVAGLGVARQLLVIAAVAAGVTPLGLIESGAAFSDLQAYRALAERSRAAGSRGSSCIHPSQIEVLNEVFTPSQAERDWAERVLEAAHSAPADRGAFALDGQMIDAPIVARAAAVLARHDAIRFRRKTAPPA